MTKFIIALAVIAFFAVRMGAGMLDNVKAASLSHNAQIEQACN